MIAITIALQAATVPQLDTAQAEQVPQAASSASLWLPTEPVPLFEPSDPIAAQLQDFGEADAGQVPSADADSVPDDSAVSDHHSAGVQHQPISSTSPPDTPQLSTPAAEQLVYDRLQELGNSQVSRCLRSIEESLSIFRIMQGSACKEQACSRAAADGSTLMGAGPHFQGAFCMCRAQKWVWTSCLSGLLPSPPCIGLPAQKATEQQDQQTLISLLHASE